MNTFRWGFNANGQRLGNVQYFLDYIDKTRPAWMLVMSNVDIAEAIYSQTQGQTNVIDRAYSTKEGNQWRNEDPINYANGLMDGRRHIWKYVLNEPNVGSEAECRARNNWLADVSIHLADNGYKGVIGNFAAGSIDRNHLQAGAYDYLLRVLSTRSDVLKLGYHEYAALLLPLGQARWLADDLRYKERVHPDTWLYLDNEDEARILPDYRVEFIPYYYHQFRWTWLQHRAIFGLGLDPVKFVFTEFGFDRFPDVKANDGTNMYDILENQHGVPLPYWTMRGAYSHEYLWAYYWPEWTISQAIWEQWIWAEKNYNEWVEGFLPFMWSFGDNWDTIDAFNFGADTELHNYMVIWSELLRENNEPENEEPMIELSDPRWQPALFTPAGNYKVNVRALPNTDPTNPPILAINQRYGYVLREEQNGPWLPARFDTDTSVTVEDGLFNLLGWIHGDYVTLTDYVPEEPEPEPDTKYFITLPLPEQGFATQAEAEAHAALLEGYALLIRNWNSTLEQAIGKVIVVDLQDNE